MDKAISVPVEVALLSFELVNLALEVLKNGNKNLSSDALLAGLLADDSFIAALNYAEINLSTLGKNRNKFSAAVSRLNSINKQMRVMRKKLRG
jgi:formiminotetrahydrofolate cyclodeaminase